MGVIAPEPKQKKARKSSSSFGGFLLFLLIAVGLPFLIIKGCSSESSGASKEPAAVESTAASEESTAAEETGSLIAEPAAETITTEAASAISSDERNYAAYSGEASYYYSQKPVKDRKGLYELTAPVVDAAKILSKNDYVELTEFILATEHETGVQIAVLTVQSLDGEDIESYSMKHAEKWQLGQKGVDNGALLTVAMEEHAVRIETGYGTEGALTDAKCSRIIRNVIVPAFRNGNYSEGIISGVKNMAGIITSDESLVTAGADSEADESDDTSVGEDLVIFILFCLVAVFITVMAIINSLGSRKYRRGFHSGNVLHNGMNGMNNSTHFSGGSSFGGFHGGGGGFGGGGASGHW